MTHAIGFKYLTFTLLASFLVVLGPARPAQAESDPEAIAVAERLMEAMGGKANWDAQRVIAFRWNVVRDDEVVSNRLHIWDRFTGQYRLEGETQEGVPLRVLFNTNTRDGDVWLGDQKLDPEAKAPQLERAYGRFINDTYWLLMPWKWLDPGVTLSYEGEETLDGEIHDVVRLQFGDDIGLTWNDQYWGYVSRKTSLMTQWQFLLQDEKGNPGTGDRSTFIWSDWEPIGDDEILLATTKTRVADGPVVAIRYPLMQLSRDASESALNPPPPPATAPPEEAYGTTPEAAGIRTLLVVLNKSAHTAALVDPATHDVLRTVPTGIGPHEGAVSLDGKTLYVANYGAQTAGNTISVIDLPTGEVQRVLDLGEHQRPHGIMVDAQGAVWVTTENSNSVVQLSAEDLSIQNVYVTAQSITHMLVLSPDGRYAFTANIGSGSVSRINAEDGTVESVPTGAGAEGIDISPDGKEIWVAHRDENTLAILDPETLDAKATLPTGEVPIRVRMTPDGKRVLVSCAASNELVVYDRKGRKELARVQLEDTPVGILVTPDGKTAYVANTGSDKVSIIDLRDLTVTGTLSPGREPDGLAWASW